ncbi:MAG TPA: hypothetical protein VI172_05010 [Candidatus Dormibacteraeota bacterium]
MTFSTDLGWLNIQELEPRVGRILTVAIKAMAQGEAHTHGPHFLYGDMKPYLSTLLGSGRSSSRAPIARHEPPRDYEVEMLAVVSEPWSGTVGGDEYLHNQWLFDVACNYILDELTSVYDSLYGYAA